MTEPLLDYVAIAKVAETLIAGSGRTVTILKFNESEQDPAKPWKGSSNPRLLPDFEVTTIATFVNPSSAVNLGIATESSELVKNSEKIMLVAPGATIIEDLRLADEVQDEDLRWKVVGVTTLKPADKILLYYIGVKR